MKKIKVILLVISIFQSLVTFTQEKIKIEKAEDLPKHSYPLTIEDAVAFVQDKEKVLDLAKKVQKNILNDLDKYEIQDKSALKSMYTQLRLIAVMEGEFQKAENYIEKERNYSEKASEKLTRGMETEILINALNETKNLDRNEISKYITEKMEIYLSTLDFSIIQEDIEAIKGQLEIFSIDFMKGILQGQLQQAINNNQGQIPDDLVSSLINIYYMINYSLPYKDAYYTAFKSSLDKYGIEEVKTNIWKDREVTLNASSKSNSVVIAIWDTGIDVANFPENSYWKNKNEKLDGKDNDNNGFIDDVYGIAFDKYGIQDTGTLEPVANNLKNKMELQENLKGLMDIQANINSEEASNLKIRLSELKPEKVDKFIEDLGLYGHYAHGTHVAGIAVEGNPMAKALTARLTFDSRSIPVAPDEKIANQWAKMFTETVAYFKTNNVKVVNMSWTVDFNYEFVRIFELNGIGENDEERKQLAKKLFDIERESFIKALESASDILFVCGAGNENNDIDFAGSFPSSLNLPNLITVGAVDVEGKKTSFTTEGESVDVFANGYEVESYVPGGDRIAFSGTSMASPQVANLAAKILAVNPDLSPEQIINIIKNTATKSEEDENVLLIYPKKAIDMAKKNKI